MYNSNVLEIFSNPQNMGKLPKSDAIGKFGSVEDGNLVKLYLQIDGEVISSAKFEAFGCVSTIASGAVVTSLITGKTIDQALKIKDADVLRELGDLPESKLLGVTYAVSAIKDAITNYRKMLVKEGKLSKEDFDKLSGKKTAKKVVKPKKTAKKTAKVVKEVQVEQSQTYTPSPATVKKVDKDVNKLMLLTKKITTTKKVTNTVK